MSKDENELATMENNFITTQTNIATGRELLVKLDINVKEQNEIINNYEMATVGNNIMVERKQKHMDDCNRTLSDLLQQREVS